MIKRLFDILASLFLMVTLGSLMLCIAVLIRLESPGRAVFRQRRAGLRGAAFTMLKFRTMRKEVDAYAGSPHGADDERLTRIGRFLRETSLDELLQLFNVLGGDMSLVGPRPLYERQAAQWNAEQRRRLDVRPGITGYAQAYGRGGITIEEKIEMDLYYVDHGGCWMDMRIMLRTIVNVFVRRGEVYEKRYSRDSGYEEGRKE